MHAAVSGSILFQLPDPQLAPNCGPLIERAYQSVWFYLNVLFLFQVLTLPWDEEKRRGGKI